MMLLRLLSLMFAFVLGFIALLTTFPVLLAAVAFSGWTAALWLGIWLIFIWIFWRLMAFSFDLKRKPLIKSPRRAVINLGKLIISGALLWLFWFGPLAPWEVVLYAPNSTQQMGSVKRGEYFISYKACQKKLMSELAKQTPITFPAAPEDTLSNGYCGQGCWPNSDGVAENMSCYQTWGAREL